MKELKKGYPKNESYDTVAAMRKIIETEELFLGAVLLGKKIDLFSAVSSFSLDGTKIKPNASDKRSSSKADLEKRLGELRTELSEYLSKVKESCETDKELPEVDVREGSFKIKRIVGASSFDSYIAVNERKNETETTGANEEKEDHYSNEDFSYNDENDTWLCPKREDGFAGISGSLSDKIGLL